VKIRFPTGYTFVSKEKLVSFGEISKGDTIQFLIQLAKKLQLTG